MVSSNKTRELNKTWVRKSLSFISLAQMFVKSALFTSAFPEELSHREKIPHKQGSPSVSSLSPLTSSLLSNNGNALIKNGIDDSEDGENLAKYHNGLDSISFVYMDTEKESGFDFKRKGHYDDYYYHYYDDDSRYDDYYRDDYYNYGSQKVEGNDHTYEVDHNHEHDHHHHHNQYYYSKKKSKKYHKKKDKQRKSCKKSKKGKKGKNYCPGPPKPHPPTKAPTKDEIPGKPPLPNLNTSPPTEPKPTAHPTTSEPTPSPITVQPTEIPSDQPVAPTPSPTTGQPTEIPSDQPAAPTPTPSVPPTVLSSLVPSSIPTPVVSNIPSSRPTLPQPSPNPSTVPPTSVPSGFPLTTPSSAPLTEPSSAPSSAFSNEPTTSIPPTITTEPSDAPTDTDTPPPSNAASLPAPAPSPSCPEIAFINEFHYQNQGIDATEFVEIATNIGYDRNRLTLYFYDGETGTVYRELELGTALNKTTINNTIGFTFTSYPLFTFTAPQFANGPDGLALVDSTANSGKGKVLDFIAYGETNFIGMDGPANGLESVLVGVEEPQDASRLSSIQRTGTGYAGTDFTWTLYAVESTEAALNKDQVIVCPPSSISPTSTSEEDIGSGGGRLGDFVGGLFSGIPREVVQPGFTRKWEQTFVREHLLE